MGGDIDRQDFEAVVTLEIERAKRAESSVTLLLLQVRQPGDSPSHYRDELLEDVDELVSLDVRETDLVTRFDDSTLAVALLDTAPKGAARVIARFQARFEAELPDPRHVTIGAASSPADAIDFNSLTERARHNTQLKTAFKPDITAA